MRALNLIPRSISGHYAHDEFAAGLSHLGYAVTTRPFAPNKQDLVLGWNRRTHEEHTFKEFERVGATVLITENGYLGKKMTTPLGEHQYYSLAENHHNGAGKWCTYGPARWASFGIELQPWRGKGSTLILGQRGIGEVGVRSPTLWGEQVSKRYGLPLRQHPGAKEATPLEQALQGVESVVTWASGGALKALTMGVAVFYDFPKWIGAQASRPLHEHDLGPYKNSDARLQMFERLAWTTWARDEITSGAAMRSVLGIE